MEKDIMSKEIAVAFVGVHRASSFFRAFQAHHRTTIVALCDVNQGTLAEVGRAVSVTQLWIAD